MLSMSEFNMVLDEEGVDIALLFDFRRLGMWKQEIAIEESLIVSFSKPSIIWNVYVKIIENNTIVSKQTVKRNKNFPSESVIWFEEVHELIEKHGFQREMKKKFGFSWIIQNKIELWN